MRHLLWALFKPIGITNDAARIVRDYEKYIARQFKRGTSRQELNVSWLKKNELDLKRHVNELRDSVRNNWSTTGQELTKELRQFWQQSRPGSPARGRAVGNGFSESGADASGLKSPTALAHLSHLDVPRAESPSGRASHDFATGYSLGLIGGVRSWVGYDSHSRSFLTQPLTLDRIDDAQPYIVARQPARELRER